MSVYEFVNLSPDKAKATVKSPKRKSNDDGQRLVEERRDSVKKGSVASSGRNEAPKKAKRPSTSSPHQPKQEHQQQAPSTANEHDSNFYNLFYDSIQRFKSINEEEEMEKYKIEEWKLVAAYFDKIFFWIFLIFTLVFSFVCLVVAPTYQYFKTY